MNFCGRNDSFLPVWEHGISPCFYHTVIPTILLQFIVTIWIVHRCWRKRYIKDILNIQNGINHDNDIIQRDVESGGASSVSVHQKRHGFNNFPILNLPIPFLYVVQLLLHVLLIIHPLVNILVKVLECYHCVCGADILSAVVNWMCWMVALFALKMERKYYFHMKVNHHSTFIILFWTIAVLAELLVLISWDNSRWKLVDKSSNYFGLIMLCLKCLFTLGTFLLGIHAPGVYKQKYENDDKDVETGSKHGKNNKSSLNALWGKLKKLWPFVWPNDNWLRLRVLLCFMLLIGTRVVNVYVPLQNKKIINYLSDKRNKDDPWRLITFYMFLSFLQGSGSLGLLNNIRSFLWVRVQQYTSRSVQVQVFEHLHDLSLRWHMSRKTGEVIRMVDRGADSIEKLLSYFIFQVTPAIVDIFVALVFFGAAFNGWFALIVFGTMFFYIAATIGVTEWRIKYKRAANKNDNIMKAIAVDSLLNFETVKYYSNESFENSRYTDRINDFQNAEWMSIMSLNLLKTVQNVVISAGMLAGMLYCGTLVTRDVLTIGDFVLFMSYIRQLYTPLNFFGRYYRMIQSAFVDMENMFELLEEKVEVEDDGDASVFQMEHGVLEFKDVYFAYEETRPILRGISFNVLPGQTLALVGPTGSGKSTIIRLLFRFYDLTNGCILIDGQDIRNVTQKSLRRCIGVVPQDTVLFNDSIKFNIQYGRINSKDNEIKEASKSADIHEKIESFINGYNTVVGERGLKLSGGEKQRVAIARTMLKAPDIILLDEATSALDTQTERNIQASLHRICVNKTSVVVAHRLSTIVSADQILVLKDGLIVERGRHQELLDMGGTYARMWNQQLEEGDM